MSISWFSEDKRSYSQGSQEDMEKYFPNAIFCEMCPGIGYNYDFDKKQWHKTLEACEMAWQELRNTMLEKTFWLLGDDSPFDASEIALLRAWRSSIQEMFDQDPVLIEEPEYPDFVKRWV